ncbi:RNA-directed DNA polymerase, eukaryota, reverse transcriptase zinc-binding domain protein [Tanacetum coccineum]
MDFTMAVWNIRGMSTSDKQKEVRKLIKEERLQLCGIIETHVKYQNILKIREKVFRNWEFVSNGEDNNRVCRIMVGWNPNKLRAWLIAKTKQFSSNEMNKFKECIGKIEMEDVLSSGFHLPGQRVGVLKEYYDAIRDENNLLMQKAKIEWLKDGDRNTEFFHKIIKGRMHKGRIITICNEKGERFENEKVAEQFVKHFQDFLGKGCGD